MIATTSAPVHLTTRRQLLPSEQLARAGWDCQRPRQPRTRRQVTLGPLQGATDVQTHRVPVDRSAGIPTVSTGVKTWHK